MFYPYVHRAWQAGRVRIGLPPVGHAGAASFEASGFARWAVALLSPAEKARLIALTRVDAVARRDAGVRPQLLRDDLVIRLGGYTYQEITDALAILSEDDSRVVSLNDLRRVWDRVSAALDRHADNSNALPDLYMLEAQLAEAGRYGSAEDASN